MNDSNYEIEYAPEPKKPQALKTDKESAIWSGLKNVGKIPFRAAETAAGRVADLTNFASNVVNAVNPYGVTPEEKKLLLKDRPHLPTSEELKEVSHKVAPWTKSEPDSWGESLDRTTETLTSLLGPEGFAGGAKKAVSSVLGSEMVGWAAKKLGASEGTQSALRTGTLFLTQLHGGREKVRNIASKGFEEAEKLAGNATVASPGVLKTAKKMASDLNLGGGELDEANAWLKPWVTAIVDKFNNGTKVGVRDMIKLSSQLKKQLRSGNVPYEARSQVNKLINSIDTDSVGKFASKNKGFSDVFYPAKEAWSALYGETKFTDFMNKHLSGKPWASWLAKGLFHGAGYGAGHYIGGIPQGAAILGAGLTARESYRFADLMKKSAIARDTYFKLMRDGLAGNVQSASREAARLDKIAAKYEEQNPEEQEIESDWEVA